LIDCVAEITPEIEAAAGGAGSARGTGGMVAKLQSARTVTEAGIPMIICNGDDPAMLYAIMDGTFIGTYFEAKGTRV
jgi:glutamate 5-kinase